MKTTSVYLGLVSGITSAGILLPAIAQVTPDGTTNTTVNSTNHSFTILNGIEKGNNLFHSFSNFSVPTDGKAIFDLSATPHITTIFSRVTGGNISQIDGLIQTLNTQKPVSLFLINPNGIVFGENARLNIGGSFVGTTANSIKFSDGVEFSAVNAAEPPLLTMSVPVGLQMGMNPGAINVQGRGHNLRGGINSALTGTKGVPQLNINSGNTLALIGGMVTVDGGVIAGEGANIEITSVGSQNQNGIVGLTPTTTGWNFDYRGISHFAAIDFRQRALVDASGLNPGMIQLRGKDIEIADGSLILIDNQGTGTSGSIIANASEKLKIIGGTSNLSVDSRLITYTTNSGKSGDIVVAAKQLILEQGGDLAALTYGQGEGGNVTVDVSDLITVGDADVNPQSTNRIASQISTSTYGSGQGGNLIISTKQLNLFPRAGITTGTAGNTGAGGNLTINASESVNMLGVAQSPNGILISASSFGQGQAGDVEINTRKLRLLDGAAIGASNFGTGSGGKIIVNASESIELSGARTDLSLGTVPSQIAASSRSATPGTQRLYNLEPIPRGNSGSIILNSPVIEVTNGSEIAVRNEGRGNGGNLSINTGRLFLNNRSQLQGTSKSGTGGNLAIKSENLLLRNGSSITATAGENGDGGNISIASPTIVGLENSDIIANAVQGKGGNIDIKTQGIIGLEFRNTLTPREDLTNDITASSQFDVNGTVNINNVGVDPFSGLIELPVNLTDPSQQIAAGCADITNSSFIVSGRGGIPQNPNQNLRSDRTWPDIRNISAFRQNHPIQTQISTPPQTLKQATGWLRNAQGKVELVAENAVALTPHQVSCAGVSPG